MQPQSDLTNIPGIGSAIADKLAAAGYETLAALGAAEPDALIAKLDDVKGLSRERVERWVEAARGLSDLAAQTAAGTDRRDAAGRETGERRETFVLTVVADHSGRAIRSHAEHPRSGASADWRGWSAAPFAAFVTEQADLLAVDRPGEALLKAAPDDLPFVSPATEQAGTEEAGGARPARIDAGYVVGGAVRDIVCELDIGPFAALGHEPVRYEATLESSELGSGERRAIARRVGEATPGERVPLLLSEVPVPHGVHHLEVVVDVLASERATPAAAIG